MSLGLGVWYYVPAGTFEYKPPVKTVTCIKPSLVFDHGNNYSRILYQLHHALVLIISTQLFLDVFNSIFLNNGTVRFIGWVALTHKVNYACGLAT
jgi:hypothetical protein